MEDKEFKKVCKYMDLLITLVVIGLGLFIAIVFKILEMVL